MIYFISQIPIPLPISPDQMKALVDEASQRDFKWWFAVIFAILLGFFYMVFRLLVQQLKEQRTAHNAANERLITYVQADHSASLLIMQEIKDSLQHFTAAIRVFIEVENRKEKRQEQLHSHNT